MTAGWFRRLWATLAHEPAAIGVAAMVAVAGWQAATIQLNYHGDYTALFCTGASWVLPPELDKTTYRFAGSAGYDGQFYRLVAHDPWLARVTCNTSMHPLSVGDVSLSQRWLGLWPQGSHNGSTSHLYWRCWSATDSARMP